MAETESRPLSTGDLPSSFDGSPEFFEEGRTQKLWRKLKQEPLIPLGCAATTYALYMASKSIRAGDHHQTNRMFRARIYAQGFTLVAIVAGSIFYKDERMKRKAFEGAVEDKKAAEKRDKWLRELEARDNEDRDWRAKVEGAAQMAHEASMAARDSLEKSKKAAEQAGADAKQAVENKFSSKSIKEEVVEDGWGPGTWALRISEAWRRS